MTISSKVTPTPIIILGEISAFVVNMKIDVPPNRKSNPIEQYPSPDGDETTEPHAAFVGQTPRDLAPVFPVAALYQSQRFLLECD